MERNVDAVPEVIVKSKKRVADHGEVFTPNWMVENMLDLVIAESERIDSRFLEPACGSGNFLVPVLRRKFSTVESRYGKNKFEKQQHALLALMCIYGLELLEDNAGECREALLQEFARFLSIHSGDVLLEAAAKVLSVNIIEGDALTLLRSDGHPIHFPEWAYLGKGKFQRRDFIFDDLIQMSSFGQGTLFEALEPDDIFKPFKTYAQMNVQEIADHLNSSKSQ